MIKGWQIVIHTLGKGRTRRFRIHGFGLYCAAPILLISLFSFATGLFQINSVSQLKAEKTALEQKIKLKDNQLQFFANRMSEILKELDGMRDLTSEVETKLGRKEVKPEAGLGGPVREKNRKNIRQLAYLNSESELLDQMWSEVEELELETKMEKGRSVALVRFLRSQSSLLRAIPSTWPLKSGYVSSPFGRRNDPFTGQIKMHTGIDIANSNHVPIYATAEGIVLQTEWSDSYGKVITLYHGFGLSTRYAHLQSFAVKDGDWVEKGQVIGLVGDTGRTQSRHVHYEVRIEGRPVNPYYFLPSEEMG
jgi:murein DD-endopeptidase MepM/ murein hydrolase activator NlpD